MRRPKKLRLPCDRKRRDHLSETRRRGSLSRWNRALCAVVSACALVAAAPPPASADRDGGVVVHSPSGVYDVVFAESKAITLRWAAPPGTRSQTLVIEQDPDHVGGSRTDISVSDTVREHTLQLRPGIYEWHVNAYVPPSEMDIYCSSEPGLSSDECARYAFPSDGACHFGDYQSQPPSPGPNYQFVCSYSTGAFHLLDGLRKKTARSYMKRVASLSAPVGAGRIRRVAKARCTQHNPLLFNCSIKAKGRGYRLRGSGLIFHPYDPYATHFGYRVRFKARYRCGWRWCTRRWRELAPSERWVCRLMPVPFIEQEDPVDPRC